MTSMLRMDEEAGMPDGSHSDNTHSPNTHTHASHTHTHTHRCVCADIKGFDLGHYLKQTKTHIHPSFNSTGTREGKKKHTHKRQ